MFRTICTSIIRALSSKLYHAVSAGESSCYSHIAARLTCTYVQNAWYSLLDSAPDDGRVVRPKHVEQVKNGEIKSILYDLCVLLVLLRIYNMMHDTNKFKLYLLICTNRYCCVWNTMENQKLFEGSDEYFSINNYNLKSKLFNSFKINYPVAVRLMEFKTFQQVCQRTYNTSFFQICPAVVLEQTLQHLSRCGS